MKEVIREKLFKMMANDKKDIYAVLIKNTINEDITIEKLFADPDLWKVLTNGKSYGKIINLENYENIKQSSTIQIQEQQSKPTPTNKKVTKTQIAEKPTVKKPGIIARMFDKMINGLTKSSTSQTPQDFYCTFKYKNRNSDFEEKLQEETRPLPNYFDIENQENLVEIVINDPNYAKCVNFDKLKNLKKITFGKNIETIVRCNWPKSIEEIEVQEGASNIRKLAFYGLPNLRRVKISDSITHIEDNVFSRCGEELTKVRRYYEN